MGTYILLRLYVGRDKSETYILANVIEEYTQKVVQKQGDGEGETYVR